MYHLLTGLHAYLTRKETFSVIIIGLDNAGKTTMLEQIKVRPVSSLGPPLRSSSHVPGWVACELDVTAASIQPQHSLSRRLQDRTHRGTRRSVASPPS